ncbi:MAG: hypothetical protein KAX20_01180 [Candidatus Omnitrophica bacterium]|nr:hypothetical protein [Candidatus Omnitrophota bacterium]
MKKGFTLIEITLTILIIIIISIGIVSIFSYGFGISTETREIFIATQAAQEEMELIRDMAFNNIVGGTFTTPGFAHLANPVGTVTVDDTYIAGEDDIKKVTVTVSWTSAQGRSSTKSLVTLITREGIDKQ